MNKSILGIDLGTSSVKVLQRYSNGTTIKAKAKYDDISPQSWWNAICKALAKIRLQDVSAIGLTSQVGTYIVNGQDVISWNAGTGAEELSLVKSRYSQDIFLREISMPHPEIVSYPIPRLTYIKNHFSSIERVCMPKDFICEMLTGNFVTDPYSWRGLANLEKKDYSDFFLNEIGIDRSKLPRMVDVHNIAGYTKRIQLGGRYLKSGIPVYVGLNDYYAGLLGMGIIQPGDMFDISGTSEHVGIIEESMRIDTKMVSGPYLKHQVHYGVTASSGASLNTGLSLAAFDKIEIEEMRTKNPPIFLPYLNGERAPIWDMDARGVFFGINKGCKKEELAYSVMEGVVFSLYHIYESMGMPKADKIKVAGGAAVYRSLNRLKAEMFGLPVAVLEENDTSAVGAILAAAVGSGWYDSFEAAVKDVSVIKEVIEPTGEYKQWLEQRYAIYKNLYPTLKMEFKKLKEIDS